MAFEKATAHSQTQNYILSMLEKCKSAVVKGKPFGTALTNLSKALIAFLKNFYLQNYMRMVLAWEHWDWYIVTSLTENKKQE